MKGFNKILICCKQATYLHEKQREGKLRFFERMGLAIHLLYCSFCKLFIKQIEQLETCTKQYQQIQENKNKFSSSRKAELQKVLNEAMK